MKIITIANADINELVQVQNKQVVTTSQKVAEVFEKQHKDVLRAIEKYQSGKLRSDKLLLRGDIQSRHGQVLQNVLHEP